MAEHDGICRNPECPAHRVGFDHTHLEPGSAKATLSVAAPQSAVERPLLGEFIEVVVRVPIDRSGAAQAVWGVPGDYTHAAIVEYLREAYPNLAAFVSDWWDEPGTQVMTRLRAKDHNADTLMPGWLRDETVNIWGGGVGDAVEG